MSNRPSDYIKEARKHRLGNRASTSVPTDAADAFLVDKTNKAPSLTKVYGVCSDNPHDDKSPSSSITEKPAATTSYLYLTRSNFNEAPDTLCEQMRKEYGLLLKRDIVRSINVDRSITVPNVFHPICCYVCVLQQMTSVFPKMRATVGDTAVKVEAKPAMSVTGYRDDAVTDDLLTLGSSERHHINRCAHCLLGLMTSCECLCAF